MAGIFFVDFFRRALRERARTRRTRIATGWPSITAQVNTWKILPAGDASDSFTNTDYIEAAFHFILNGEFFGGYASSVPMPHREAEKLATGSPQIIVRYNPADPDETAVLAEDNRGKLPFALISG
jgi:hypothetical protein